MKIYNISPINTQSNYNVPSKGVNRAIPELNVFYHHIYEYHKGIRNLILTTEKSKYRNDITQRLEREKIDYLIQDVTENKINVFFGAKECVDVVKTFAKNLKELTPEQDFMLGIMLGYGRLQQCVRYLKIKNGDIHLSKVSE